MLGMVTLFHSNCGFEFEFERVTAVYYSSLVPCIVSVKLEGKKCYYSSLLLQDLYVYVSEDEEFSDFKNENALFWVEKGLVYGDWESGPNGDGSYTMSGHVEASEVQLSFYVMEKVYFPQEVNANGKSPGAGLMNTAINLSLIHI